MDGKTHVGIGIATFTALCTKKPEMFSITGTAIVAVGAMFPDIDHPKSIINKYILPFKNGFTKKVVYLSISIFILIINYKYFKNPFLNFLSLCFLAIGFSSHRNGLTHSLVGMIVFAFIFKYLEQNYNISNAALYFIIGYSSHLLGDMFTKKGIPILYPFKNTKYKMPLNFSTSSRVGKKIQEVIALAGIMYIIYSLPYILK